MAALVKRLSQKSVAAVGAFLPCRCPKNDVPANEIKKHSAPIPSHAECQALNSVRLTALN